MQFLIYGANGYTGELIAREAARRAALAGAGSDARPILAGRSREAIEPLARELGLDFRIFDLDAPQLEGVDVVLHCAGPFSRTSAPMVSACLAAGAHYLDITGEIAVFEAVLARAEEAKRAGVALVPGVGFDVVPTDTVAATLADALPGATELQLAFFSPGATVSRGTLATMLEGIGEGGAIRRDGRIVRVPVAYDVREIPFSCGLRTTMTVPWGDVATAFHTTRIPNIRVYTGVSPRGAKRMRRLRPFLPLLGRFPLKPIVTRIARRKQGPDATARTR
ncbi:MAG: saccharopine dehydrogenase, partial [Acidobacteria bacterium]|nr:saccharopine dehydrogenase [Acidobacteriota bacterium]